MCCLIIGCTTRNSVLIISCFIYLFSCYSTVTRDQTKVKRKARHRRVNFMLIIYILIFAFLALPEHVARFVYMIYIFYNTPFLISHYTKQVNDSVKAAGVDESVLLLCFIYSRLDFN